MNILIARHGQTNFNKEGKYQGSTDNELNEHGIRQAELLGKRLESYGIEMIYCSDLKRVMTTAEIIGRHTGSAITVKPELREINMGEWERLSQDEVMERYAEFYSEWSKHLADIPYPGGECGRDVELRTMKVIEEIIGSGNENVLVVTSGGPVRVLLSSLLGLNLENRFRIDTDNCGLSIVRYDKQSNKFYVKCVNDTSHLE